MFRLRDFLCEQALKEVLLRFLCVFRLIFCDDLPGNFFGHVHVEEANDVVVLRVAIDQHVQVVVVEMEVELAVEGAHVVQDIKELSRPIFHVHINFFGVDFVSRADMVFVDLPDLEDLEVLIAFWRDQVSQLVVANGKDMVTFKPVCEGCLLLDHPCQVVLLKQEVFGLVAEDVSLEPF